MFGDSSVKLFFCIALRCFLTKKLLRIFFLPLGLMFKLFELAKDGARDIDNKLRFKNSTIDGGCCIDISTSIANN
jgi:hypothetical protein